MDQQLVHRERVQHVAGGATEQIKADVRELLGGGNQFFHEGKVFRLQTLLQILTRAGGLTVFADRSNIRVVRRDGDKVTEYVADYDGIIKGDLKQDILLRPGDRIIVP